MKLQILKASEKKKIEEKLNQQYGISKLPYLLIKTGAGKIKAYSGSLSREELQTLAREINIDSIGITLLKEEKEFILTYDAVSLLKSQINKNIIEVNKQQAKDWLKGKDLHLDKDLKGIKVLKYQSFLLGAGKISEGRIANKERKIKEK